MQETQSESKTIRFHNPPPQRRPTGHKSGINYVLIKLASRCNFDCSYCYWFRDGSVRSLPPLMTDEVRIAFTEALERHIATHRLPDFVCSFHGGEPTLFGAQRLKLFMQEIDQVATRTKCDIRYAMTTNGSLLDAEWIKVISDFKISVTVSLDGPPDIHDRHRLTIKGAPTWEQAVTGYLDLCKAGVVPTIIGVCDPISDPIKVLDHFALDLGARFCDILIPDTNHSSPVSSIGDYYIKLFDHWYDNYSDGGLQVRILNEFVRSLLGLDSHGESIGLGPTQIVCLNTTGKLEPHDVLRIAGEERTSTSCSVFTHEIADIELDPLWSSVRDASVSLCEKCLACPYKTVCGGGHIAQRWSDDRQYDNPSVYCDDFIRIFEHIAGRLKSDIHCIRDGVPVGAEEIYSTLIAGEGAKLFKA